LSFREEAKGKFVVGIKGARGSEDEKNDWALVGGSGRASPRWGDDGRKEVGEEREEEIEREGGVELVLNGVSRGGGVIMISTVLVPFHP